MVAYVRDNRPARRTGWPRPQLAGGSCGAAQRGIGGEVGCERRPLHVAQPRGGASKNYLLLQIARHNGDHALTLLRISQFLEVSNNNKVKRFHSAL